MNTDITKIKAILNGKVPNQDPIVLSPKAIFDNGRFTLSSAYVIGMLCLMALATPQSFAVGRTVNITNDAVSNAAKKQYHHFFPLKSTVVSESAYYKTIANNVVNIVFMDAITNDQISNRNPSDYTSEFESGNPNLAVALESHYIAEKGYGVKEDNLVLFLNARSRALYNKLCSLVIPNSRDTITDALAIV